MNTPETVAITGLRSFVGQRLAERLAERGGRMRVVGVDLRRPYRLEGRVRFHRVDLTEPSAAIRLAEIFEAERVDTVVHAAFRRDPTPDLEYDHELQTIGTRHVAHACAAAKVKHLVMASSTMLYGARSDNPNFLTETHPLRGHPEAHCVMDRVAAEELLAQWQLVHSGTAVTVLRTCWIMGPTYWDFAVRHFAKPIVTAVLGYDPLFQFVHEEDCLRIFESAVLAPRPGVFNIVGRGVLPLSTYLRSAGKQSLPVPAPVLFRVRSYPHQAQTGDRPEGFYDYLRYLWVADGERGWNAFGEPHYTSREAWAAFISSRKLRRYR